jgi:hypothetical protein
MAEEAWMLPAGPAASMGRMPSAAMSVCSAEGPRQGERRATRGTSVCDAQPRPGGYSRRTSCARGSSERRGVGACRRRRPPRGGPRRPASGCVEASRPRRRPGGGGAGHWRHVAAALVWPSPEGEVVPDSGRYWPEEVGADTAGRRSVAEATHRHRAEAGGSSCAADACHAYLADQHAVDGDEPCVWICSHATSVTSSLRGVNTKMARWGGERPGATIRGRRGWARMAGGGGWSVGSESRSEPRATAARGLLASREETRPTSANSRPAHAPARRSVGHA